MEFGCFQGAWVLWICQIGFQFVSICIIIPLPFIKLEEDFLSEHPWVRQLYITTILFILNLLFYLDEVLEYLHWKKIIHRDLKPENIIIE